MHKAELEKTVGVAITVERLTLSLLGGRSESIVGADVQAALDEISTGLSVTRVRFVLDAISGAYEGRRVVELHIHVTGWFGVLGEKEAVALVQAAWLRATHHWAEATLPREAAR